MNLIRMGLLASAAMMTGMIRFAPPGEGNGGFLSGMQSPTGGGVGGGDPTPDGYGLQFESLDGEQEDDDPDSNPLTEIFGAEDDDDDDTVLDDGGIEPIPDTDVKGLEVEIRQAIAGMGLPQNAIPEGFDPNDRTQLNKLLNTTVQSAVSQALNVVFKPIQMAMKHQEQQLRQMMRAEVTNANKLNQGRQTLEQMVPEARDPAYKGLVAQMDKSLRDQGKTAAERAKTIRTALNKMGIQSKNDTGGKGSNRRSSAPSGSNDSIDQQVKTGVSALDSLFGVRVKAG